MASKRAATLPGDGRRRAVRGRVPAGLTILLAGVACVWGVQRLQGSARDFGFTSVDSRRVRLDPGSPGFDPRWRTRLAARLADFGDVSTLDREGLRALAREVATLPFVAEVGEPGVSWPDGLTLPVRLQVPAACVLRHGEFLTVAMDGTLLPGAWSSPPARSHVVLPVIGPLDDAFEDLVPGEVLEEPRHVDALEVAISLARHLSAADLADLGAVVIDASRARATSVDEPGTCLYLARGRIVRFGRSPGADAPGELPAAAKWSSLSRALAELRAGHDWEVLDVRWDRAAIRWLDPRPDPQR